MLLRDWSVGQRRIAVKTPLGYVLSILFKMIAVFGISGNHLKFVRKHSLQRATHFLIPIISLMEIVSSFMLDCA